MVRWPSRHTRHVASLVALIVFFGLGNLLWTANTINRNDQRFRQDTQMAIQAAIADSNRSWCDSLDLLTSGKKPASNQPQSLRLYYDFKKLEQKYGCTRR